MWVQNFFNAIKTDILKLYMTIYSNKYEKGRQWEEEIR